MKYQYYGFADKLPKLMLWVVPTCIRTNGHQCVALLLSHQDEDHNVKPLSIRAAPVLYWI